MGLPLKWRQHIEAWQQSGLSQRIYCEQQQINTGTFTARLSEYRKMTQTQSAALVPVQIKPVSAGAPPASSPGIVFTHANDHRLEFPSSVSADWLAEFIRCLG
jgi:hypothetical protein